MRVLNVIAIAGVLAWPPAVYGEILSSTESGFTSKNTVKVSVPPEWAYRRMIDRIDQ